MRIGTERVSREAWPFLRFCVVGAGGFLIDAGILALLTYGMGSGPVISRFISAFAAICGTFLLNRSWSFSDADVLPIAQSFRRYVAVQGAGFAFNLIIYVGLIRVGSGFLRDPLVALLIASAAALVVNYLGSRLYVFRAARSGRTDDPRSD